MSDAQNLYALAGALREMSTLDGGTVNGRACGPPLLVAETVETCARIIERLTGALDEAIDAVDDLDKRGDYTEERDRWKALLTPTADDGRGGAR